MASEGPTNTDEPTASALTSGRALARGATWTLLGQAAPLAAALACIPPLIRGLGADRFGVLSLAWLFVGYFSLLDLGLGRALTRAAAERLGRGRGDEIPALARSSLAVMAALGLAASGVTAALAPWLARDAVGVPDGLLGETVVAIRILSASLPLVIVSAGLRGLLEARQRFKVVSLVQSALGVLSLAGPVLVLPASRGLPASAAVLFAVRLVTTGAFLAACRGDLTGPRVAPPGGAGLGLGLGPVLRSGGWMTVSNVVGPLMVSLDRFLIGARAGVGAVAYYATPYEVVTKLWIVPGVVVRVLFPAFAAGHATDRARTALLFDRSARATLVALLPVTLAVVLLAEDGLRVWLGPEFARRSTRVMQCLAVGVFVNSLGQVAFALIQGIGRPDLTARIHLAELPFYFAGAWWLIGARGVEGAAIAWTARVVVDALLLFVVARGLLPAGGPDPLRLLPWGLLPALAMVVTPAGPLGRGAALAASLAGLAPALWWALLSGGERAAVAGRLWKRSLSRV